MMIESELYQRFGGLRGVYVQGDYEDSDLCLRLIEAGYENWYLPDVELYHLEGQSYALAARQLNGQYNTWLHTRLWKERIAAVMTRYTVMSSDEVTASGKQRQGVRKSSAATDSPARERESVVKDHPTRPDKRSKRPSGRKRRGT
jgi:hypothetical protein